MIVYGKAAWSQNPAAASVQRLHVWSSLCPHCSWYQSAAAHHANHDCTWVQLLFCSSKTGYRSPLNDFQRSEGRELVPTSWNSIRVVLLPGLNLEECASRCSRSLDCRYPAEKHPHTAVSKIALDLFNPRASSVPKHAH